MKALLFTGTKQPLSYTDVEAPTPSGSEVVVDLKAASLNHRDNWIMKGLYPGIRDNVILGSDGAGIVDDREVILNPNLDWGDDQRFPAREYRMLGMPHNGTFAEQIAVKPDRLVDKPAHLTFEEAAALPLGGLTAFRTLFVRCRMKSGDRVLINGIGGGVAGLACLFAIAAGGDVYVTSSSEEKIQKAVDLGAKGGINYGGEEWSKALGKETGGFDVIVDSAGGSGFSDLVKLTRPGARIGVYGGTHGPWHSVSPQLIFFRQIDIVGSTMGSDRDFADMIRFVNEHKIVPQVDSTYPLAEGNRAIQRMDQGKQFGKIILKIG